MDKNGGVLVGAKGKDQHVEGIGLDQIGAAYSHSEPLSDVETKHFQEVLGSLMHLANVSWPDISHAVRTIAQHTANPHTCDLDVLYDMLAYVSGTTDYGIKYACPNTAPQTLKDLIMVFSDADFAGDPSTHHSSTGLVSTAAGSAVMRASWWQPWVALSTAEAELNALTTGIHDAK